MDVADELNLWADSRDKGLFVSNRIERRAAIEITRLRAELAAAQKDAERYRWIRDNHETDPAAMWIHGNAPPDHWDAEIDAALAAKGEE